VKFAGQEKTVEISGSAPYSLGKFSVNVPGYQKLELRGLGRVGNTFIDLINVLVKGAGTIDYQVAGKNGPALGQERPFRKFVARRD